MDDTTLDLDAIRARADAALEAAAYLTSDYPAATGLSAEDVPALLAEVQRLRAQRDALAAELDAWRKWASGVEPVDQVADSTSRVVLAEQDGE